jgi:hypothetical protein
LVTARYTVGKIRHGIYCPKFWKNFERQGQKVFSSTLIGRFSHGFKKCSAAFSLPLPPAASAPLRQIASSRHRRTFRQPRGATAGSGLRLCVKDGLLQACVLLATQGDNSRIRWSASQECQHVLSSDIVRYLRN